MTEPPRRRPLVGAAIRRRRRDRNLTLSAVAELTSLNVGYLSQVENDKASPSLETLSALADALDVPIAWFLLDQSVGPRVVRAADRPRRRFVRGGTLTQVDGGIARDVAIFEGEMPIGVPSGLHAHPATSITSCCPVASESRRATRSSRRARAIRPARRDPSPRRARDR